MDTVVPQPKKKTKPKPPPATNVIVSLDDIEDFVSPPASIKQSDEDTNLSDSDLDDN